MRGSLGGPRHYSSTAVASLKSSRTSVPLALSEGWRSRRSAAPMICAADSSPAATASLSATAWRMRPCSSCSSWAIDRSMYSVGGGGLVHAERVGQCVVRLLDLLKALGGEAFDRHFRRGTFGRRSQAIQVSCRSWCHLPDRCAPVRGVGDHSGAASERRHWGSRSTKPGAP
jgi:hypothetical protein